MLIINQLVSENRRSVKTPAEKVIEEMSENKPDEGKLLITSLL